MASQRYTAKQVADALVDAKGMLTVAARRLGCHADTVRTYVKRYPTVAKAVINAREAMTDVAELKLFQAITNGEAWAISLYLKTIGKHRGYVERIESALRGDEDHPLPIVIRTITAITPRLEAPDDDG